MGKWTARQSYKHPESWRVDDEAMITVAIVDDYHRGNGENERLARLIAAAPCLLEACKAAVLAARAPDGGGILIGIDNYNAIVQAIAWTEGR
jgi:hypothetical protein